METAKVQLRLLGAFSAASPVCDLTPVLAQPKRIGLIVRLILTRPHGLHRRDTLCALLWPESSEEHARSALRQLLSTLRRELGSDVLVTEADLVGLNPIAVTSDATAVLDALDAGADEEAVRLYSGELLPGLHVEDCDSLERWLEHQRMDLKRRVCVAAWRLVDRAEQGGDIGEARALAERAWAIDPDDEEGLRRLLTLQARNGDRAAALVTFEGFARRLQADWGAHAEPATVDLIEQIRSNRMAGSYQTPVDTRRVPEVLPEPGAAERAEALEPDAGTKPLTARKRVAVLVGVLLAATLLLATVRLTGTDRSLVPDRVLVAPFANQTGDPALDAMGLVAADWVIQGLQRSGFAEVVDAGTAYLTTYGLQEEMSGRMPQLRQLAQGTRAGLVVGGAIARVGDSAEYSARVADARSGRILRVVDPIRGLMADPTPALDELRSRIAGAIASETDVPMAPLTRGDRPPRIEAYREFAAGLPLFTREDYVGAAARFRRAWALDSTFVQAAMWLDYAYGNAGLGDSATLLERRLLERPHLLTPLVRAELDAFALEASEDSPFKPVTTATINQIIDARRVAARLSPASENEWKLADRLHMLTGRNREAVRILLALDKERNWLTKWPSYWGTLVTALHMAGEYEDELRMARHPANPVQLGYGSQTLGAAAVGDLETVRASSEKWLASSSPFGGVTQLAGELEAHGHREKAIRLLEWGEPLVRARYPRFVGPEAPADYFTHLAVLAAYTGNRKLASEARAKLESFLGGNLGRMGSDQTGTIVRLFGYATAVCAEGDSGRIARLPHPVPEPWGPIDLAQAAACRGDHAEALRHLEQAGHNPILHIIPLFHVLRGSPRYQAWLHPEDHGR